MADEINAPLHSWLLQYTDNWLPQEDEIVVVYDKTIRHITPDPDVKLSQNASLYKELVLTYISKDTKDTNYNGPVKHKKRSDMTWVVIVWNNMAKHYNAFLKSIDTAKKTLLFAVSTERDFLRLKLMANYFPEDLQTNMVRRTDMRFEGLRPQLTSTESDSAFSDSDIDMDSSITLKLGVIQHCLREMKTDMNEIKSLIVSLNNNVKRRKPARSHSTRSQQSLRKIRQAYSTSTEDDYPLILQDNYPHDNEKDSDLYTDCPFANTVYGEPKRREINHEGRLIFKSFHLQENPVIQNEQPQRDMHMSRQKETENIDLDEVHLYRRKKKGKLDPTRRKRDTLEKLNLPLRDSSLSHQSTGMVPRGTVKVLNPRPVDTATHHRTQIGRSTENKTSQSLRSLNLIQGVDSQVTQKQLPQGQVLTVGRHQTPLYDVQLQGSNDLPSQGLCQTQPANKSQENDAVRQVIPQQQAVQLDEGQRSNEVLRQQTIKANTNDEDSERSNYSHTQQQLENTERLEKPTDDKSVDDASLLHNVICEMEQRGEVNLETDGITDPDILSRLFTTNKEDETKKPENKIDFKTEQTGKEDVENAVDIQDEHFNKEDVKKQLLGETGESAIKNSHSDEEPNRKAPETWEAQTATDSARKDDDSDEDVSDNASTVTSDIQESSLESGICFQPDVESSTMLKRVGLNPTEALVHVLNQNKKSIEDNSHEVKGNGIDTVLLLDASSSIDEKSFCQMKSACLNIVEFIESVAASKGIEENIALIVIGRNPMILQHLTIDYREMYDKIETIEPGGSSPMCIGTLLSLLELQLRGGVTSISRYQIPPRIILMTDGRPTDDHSFKYQESEFGMKSPMVKNSVLLAMDELRHGGYELVCVPVGQAVNRAFIGDMIERAGGSIAEIDDLGNVKKHFLYHYTIAKVIQKCKETDFEDLYMEVIEAETTALLSSSWSDVTFTEADVTMMKTIIEKSEELKTIEYLDLNLPPLGSRISVPEVHSTADSVHPRQFGTVILHKPTGTIKVEWDVGTISFLDFDLRNVGLCIVKEPRRLAQDSLIDVGVEVLKGTERGRVFLTTSNGYVKVRWDNGSFGRYRFGADGAFDLNIALESYSFDSYIWQYFAGQGCWATYHETDLTKIEKAFARRQKTAITKSGRIVFAAMRETLLHGSWKQRAVRRITVEEAIFM